MLEVVFNDSAKGSMKQAKNYNSDAMLSGAIGYVGEKPTQKELKKMFEGKAIGGNPRDVVCIGFNLDIGDISDEVDSPQRKAEFVRVFNSVSFEDSEVEQYFETLREDLDKVYTAAVAGKTIRVWKSNAPFSACGYAFLCNALTDIDCKINVVQLPEYTETAENTIQTWTDWAEVGPGHFYKYLPLEREVSNTEKQMQSFIWCELKTENAPIRAFVNGKLMSVPEDFYDHILIRNIPENDFTMGQLIGAALGKYPCGVGDGWYALRIKKMIAENKLEVVVDDKDPSNPYGKVLRKL
ncbi:DUF1835 domain-containing protein [Christensenellaceae bacterium OttesenSCG-928-K19]|nr:DUF1835 domain-containing protein [Christensenellaceae bacterium OttesenSCG-928-K19]